MNKLKIGLDIDDVLCESSRICEEYGIKYLADNNIPFQYNEALYDYMERFSISKVVHDEMLSYLDRYFLGEVSQDAVKSLHELAHVYPVEYVIITARLEHEALPIIKILAEEHNLRIDEAYFDVHNKAELCEEIEVDVLLDDSSRNILQFHPEQHCKGILVSLPYVKHNKPLSRFYKYVLHDWTCLTDVLSMAVENFQSYRLPEHI